MDEIKFRREFYLFFKIYFALFDETEMTIDKVNIVFSKIDNR